MAFNAPPRGPLAGPGRGPISNAGGPNRTPNRGGRGPIGKLKGWFEDKKAKQQVLEEEAVRKISNKIENNALTLIDALSNVDFIESKLPEGVLTNYAEGTRYCQLEYDTKALITMIRDDPQNINMDIRPIDEKLMTLVLMFKQFVAHGDPVAAKMALDALTVGIQDIRCKIPVHQPNLADAFVSENTEYLDKWVTLVGLAQNYDHLKNNHETELAATLDAENKKAAKTENVAHRIETEHAFSAAFFYILDHDSNTDRANWDKAQREVHTLMVDAKMEDFNIRLHRLQSITFENDMIAAKQAMESLRTCLNRLPNISDPDLMNKYREAMDQFVKDVAESDARMEETINAVDKLSAALDQLDNSAGATLANEAAQAQAHKILAAFQNMNAQETGENALEHFRNLKEHGWLTKEERERQKAENDARLAQEQAKLAQLKQQAKSTNTQRAKQAN